MIWTFTVTLFAQKPGRPTMLWGTWNGDQRTRKSILGPEGA